MSELVFPKSMPKRFMENYREMPDGVEKKCRNCCLWKAISEYSPASNGLLKLNSWCKPCAAKRMTEYRAKHPEIREYQKRRRYERGIEFRRVQRAWEEKNKAKRLRQCKEWRRSNPARWRELMQRYEKSNPDKVRARKEVSRAVKEGRITKPDLCSLCDMKTSNNDLHGHHEDYSKIFEIVWLCRTCHAKLHMSRKCL